MIGIIVVKVRNGICKTVHPFQQKARTFSLGQIRVLWRRAMIHESTKGMFADECGQGEATIL